MSTLAELLGSDPPLPIDDAALQLAAELRPEVSPQRWRQWLDAMAEPLAARLPSSPTPEEQAQQLADHVYGSLGFRGDTDDYYHPDNSHLDRVLERRTGIPLTLAMVLVGVGRRTAIRVEGVGFPGHFLARIGGPDGVLVDPFGDGRILVEAALHRLAHQVLGDASRLQPAHLEPVGTPAMIARMLANLQLAHRRRGEHGKALLAADHLVQLTGFPEHRRDRGAHAFAFGSWGMAVDDFEAYLEARPEASDRDTIRGALAQARQRLGHGLH